MKTLPTNAELTVMRILQSEPAGLYGLQIVEASQGDVSRGSVYVLLGRLEEKGYLEVKRPRTNGALPGMPRPHYRLNAQGMRLLRHVDEHAVSKRGLPA